MIEDANLERVKDSIQQSTLIAFLSSLSVVLPRSFSLEQKAMSKFLNFFETKKMILKMFFSSQLVLKAFGLPDQLEEVKEDTEYFKYLALQLIDQLTQVCYELVSSD